MVEMRGELNFVRTDLQARLRNAKSQSEKSGLRQQIAAISDRIGKINENEARFNIVKATIVQHGATAEGRRFLANKANAPLCNVIAYNLYGRVSGTDARDFGTFYTEELRKGRIGGYEPGVDLYYGAGSSQWRDERGMSKIAVNEGATQVLPRQMREDALKNAHVALSYQDTNADGRPNHFFLIVKDREGKWKNMDHTTDKEIRRGKATDFSKVYGLYLVR